MLQVKVLGQFDVRLDGNPVVISSRAAQSLLAYLLLNPGTAHRREKLAGLLWPNATEDNARRNLRQELWRLRKALGPVFFRADDIAVTLVPGDNLRLDAAAINRAAANGVTVDELADVLTQYHGELLPGFYDEWVLPERERLRALYAKSVAGLLVALQTGRRWTDAREWAERWITLERSAEPAYRALMLAHAEHGDRAQVVSVYRRCVDALRSDLGVEPSEQTRALFEQLSSGMPAEAPLSGVATPAGPAGATPLPAPGEPPFKGLLYFDEADAANFFGREQLTAQLAAHLRNQSLLVIIGASGSGKSSLLRAGLIPALRQRGDTIYLITPTTHPLEALADSLTRHSESVSALATLMDDMARDPRSLRFALRRTSSPGAASTICLVIDQFEELFTLCRAEAERQAFVENLLGVLEPAGEGTPKVVIALRADFYAHCAEYAALRAAVAKHQEYIGPMTSDELRRSIAGPAQVGKWEFDAGLVDLIMRDAGTEPGALPLLSHALLETWRRRRGRTLTFQGYAASGGVRGAIAQTAETVYRAFNPEQQAIARNMFLRLTELGEGTQDTRRRVSLSELIPPYVDAQSAKGVLKTLADARLVSTGENYAEVAHEALIREWPTLREWLSQDRDGLRLHRHLTEAAQAWLKLNRDAGELYRGARLAQAQEWAEVHAGDLNPLEREFLDASQRLLEHERAEREAQRRRELLTAQRFAEAQRRRAMFLAGALVIAAVLAVVAAIFGRQSNQNAERAENERRIAFVRELSVNAVANLDVDPERSILLALQAVSASAAGGNPVLFEAEEALHRAVGASRLRLTLRGHSGGILSVSISPDGKRLATASEDKTIKIWDAATGRELLTLVGHTDRVSGVAFSPDGTRLASSSRDKTVKVWDVATGQELLTFSGHPDGVLAVTYSPNGTRIATAGGRTAGTPSVDHTAKVWNATTGELLLTFSGHTGSVRAIAFSPDGTRLATVSDDKTAKIWDASTGKELLTIVDSDILLAVAFSPDGKRLATGTSGLGIAKIWDASTGQALLTMTGHTAGIYAMVFSPDGKRLATAGTDGFAKVWDATTGQSMFTLAGHMGPLWGIAFSPDGTSVATSSGDVTAKVWDISPAGSREWLTLASHNGLVRDVAYSLDGTRLATASADKSAKVWDALTGKVLQTLIGHSDVVGGIALSPNGRYLATTSDDQTARIWDISTGQTTLIMPIISGHSLIGPGVAFSPDGKRLATSSINGVANVWDTTTGQLLLTLDGHVRLLNRIAYSPDGTRLATGGGDSIAMLWDSGTGRELFVLPSHNAIGSSGDIADVAFSPDGSRLITAGQDGTATIWDAVSGKELLILRGHASNLRGAIFSPDGTHVATAGSDGTAKVWDISPDGGRSDQPLTLYGHTAALNRVVFSPDGKRLATASNDGTVRVYALPLDDIVAIAKSRVTRSLTIDECQKYLHTETCPPAQ